MTVNTTVQETVSAHHQHTARNPAYPSTTSYNPVGNSFHDELYDPTNNVSQHWQRIVWHRLKYNNNNTTGSSHNYLNQSSQHFMQIQNFQLSLFCSQFTLLTQQNENKINILTSSLRAISGDSQHVMSTCYWKMAEFWNLLVDYRMLYITTLTTTAPHIICKF